MNELQTQIMNAGSIKRTALPTRRDEARALFRNAILDAAEEVIGERGFHAARIQDIAERARTAVGTVYNHFRTKEDVLRALLEERTDALRRELAPSAGEPEGFEGKLTIRLARLLAYVDRHRSFFLVALEHGLFGSATATAEAALHGKPVRHIANVKNAFAALIQEGIKAGALVDEDPARLARFLGGTIRGFVLGGLRDGVSRMEDEAPIMVALFLHGAGQRSEKRKR
jgi:AcrR family transcriptional regulator